MITQNKTKSALVSLFTLILLIQNAYNVHLFASGIDGDDDGDNNPFFISDKTGAIDSLANEIRDRIDFNTENTFLTETSESETNSSSSAALYEIYKIGQNREFEDVITNTDHANLETEMQMSVAPLEIYDDTSSLEAKIHSLNAFVEEGQRFIDRLDSLSLIELPVGIKKQIGNISYTILIDKVFFSPEGTTLNASMSLEIPQSGKKVAFAAEGVPFKNNGGLQGDVKLFLVSDNKIIDGAEMDITLLGSNRMTYVEWDCEGFKSLSVDAEIAFTESLFVKENANGTVSNEPLKSHFTTTVYDWNDLIIELSIDPFQIKGLEGVGFYVDNAVFDLSDMQNSPSLVFPDEYQTSGLVPDNPNLWRGIYIREAAIKLPREFKNKNQAGQRIEFHGYEMLIDRNGFSGLLVANHLLTMDDGDMNKWAFSLEKLSVKLTANQLKEAGFNGKINIPALKEGSTLAYQSQIYVGGDYSFSITPTENIEMSIWAAQATLYPNSNIEVKTVDGVFTPSANLYGKMTISAGLNGETNQTDKNKKLSLADITFENLKISSTKPYLKVGSFSFGSEKAKQAMSGFPLSIQNIGIEQRTDEEVGLNFTIILNLVGEGDGGFGADGSFTMVAAMDQSKSIQSWKYKSLEVHEAGINIDAGAFKLEGRVIFFKKNATYGNGFQGSVHAEFTPGLKMDAMVLFGKMETYRYWYADAMVNFSSGIPVFTGFGLYGFGGGAYFHMKQAGFADKPSGIGVSSSGILYKPDENVYLGIKASVAFGTHPTKDAFNGDATFEIAFNSRGGVSNIAFTGNAYIMTPPLPGEVTKLADQVSKLSGSKPGDEPLDKSSDRGSIAAKVLISYDFDNNVLHGNFKVFVNVAGGIIKGIGAGNLAGEAVIHYEKSDWYLYIGTPSSPVGLNIMSVIKTRSYFMVGTQILESPPPPSNVSEILGGMDLDYMKNENALGNGSGFAFGARTDISTGDLTFLMFYASFNAGVGFDVMLKNYGPDVRCKGRSEPLGINGWYANGQVYAYLEGRIGIKVKLFGKEKKCDILDIAAAAILQAKLPNPTWMRGAVGGRFNVLGGLVKGQCKFEFEIGEQCEIVGGSVLSGIQVIAELTPAEGEKDISVFNAPQAVFNMAVEKQFSLEDVDGKYKTFKIKLDHFKILNDKNEILGQYEWNDDMTVLAFDSDDLLPGQTKLKALVKVSFLEKVGGTWKPVIVEGKEYGETKETAFTTGDAPDHIPQKNVSYSYPIINQFNYYKDETDIGYIQLDKGQDYLFEVTKEWQQKGRFSSPTQKLYFNFSYDKDKNTIHFSRPAGMNTNTIYKFELVNVPSTVLVVDENVEDVETNVETEGEGNELTVTTQDAEGEVEALQEKAIYTSYFRSSKYNKLASKISGYTNIYVGAEWLYESVQAMNSIFILNEPFDKYELSGLTGTFDKLVQFETKFNGTKWYDDYVYKPIYEGYPVESDLLITNRDLSVLSVPPVKAMSIKQYYEDILLTESNILNNTANYDLKYTKYYVEMAIVADKDLTELRNKVANKYRNQPIPTDRLKLIFNSYMRLYIKGYYDINMYYVLPGTNKVVTTIPLKFKL